MSAEETFSVNACIRYLVNSPSALRVIGASIHNPKLIGWLRAWETDGQTYGRTLDRYTDPVLHAMPATSTVYQYFRRHRFIALLTDERCLPKYRLVFVGLNVHLLQTIGNNDVDSSYWRQSPLARVPWSLACHCCRHRSQCRSTGNNASTIKYKPTVTYGMAAVLFHL